MIEADHSGPSLRRSIPVLERFLQGTRRAVGLAGEVNVLVTSNRRMRSLNRAFRGKDKATDVLSFPASGNGRSRIAGDIAISLDIATINAKKLGHPVETEIKILLLHGVLHLAGYDHDGDDGEMAALEHKLRAKLRLPSGLIARAATRSDVGGGESMERQASRSAL